MSRNSNHYHRTNDTKPDSTPSYNGWKNWATWNVVLWTDNDEGAYRTACARVRRILDHKAEGGFTPTIAVYEARSIITQLWPKGTPDMRPGRRLPLRAIDWKEIAAYLQELVD